MSKLFCLNPECPKPNERLNASNEFCRHCGTELVLQNRYRVSRQLGEGGFGKIFEVEDTARLNERKVMKVLYKNNIKAVELFRREANVLSRLAHSAIPRVELDGYFEFWPENAVNPLHCLVMEFIEGENLENWVKHHQPINQALALKWLKELGEILHQLHQQQFFHRDIKPSNIICRFNGQLVLIDFGAVREITDTFLTKIGVRQPITGIVSPGYTPPEQINCNAVPQSDFYALGRTFVYLLTGKSPSNFSEDAEGKLLWRDNLPHISPHIADLIDDFMAPIVSWRPKNTQEILQRIDRVEVAIKNSSPEINILVAPQRLKAPNSLSAKLIGWVSLTALLLLGFVGFHILLPQFAIATAIVLNRQGLTLYKNRQFHNAERYYHLALQFNPNYDIAHYNLGLIYEEKRDYQSAYYHYTIAKNNEYVKAYNNLARLDILNKKYNTATSLIYHGLEMIRGQANHEKVKYALIKNLGWAYYGLYTKTQDITFLQEAETHIRAAIQQAGKSFTAYCLLAQVLEAQGNNKDALEAWQKCNSYAREQDTYLPEEKVWLTQAQQRLKSRGDI